MNQNKFYQIFNDFLIKNEISPSSNFESLKKDWIPFLHTNEKQLQECICGHKVKHFTYYFNVIHKTIISIGTSCCKKYGFSQKTMGNDIFIHILRDQIIQSFYEKRGNLVILTNNLELLLEEYIFEKFKLFTGKYVQTIDKNYYYFDVCKPLEKMKNDIFELIEKYGYHLHKYYDEIIDYLLEREIIMNEQDVFETNSEIIHHLDVIEREISEILDHREKHINPIDNEQYYLGNKHLYVGNPELYIVHQSPLEETSFIHQSPLEENHFIRQSPLEETSFIHQSPLEETSLEETSLEETSLEEGPLEETSLEESLLEETYLEETSLEEGPLEETSLEESLLEETYLEETSLEETSLEENLEIEETIKNELKNQNELEEKEAMYYLENENKELNNIVKDYYEISTNVKHNNEIHTDLSNYKEKIQKLENQIFYLKYDILRFSENVRSFKNNVNNLVMMIDISKRLYKIK